MMLERGAHSNWAKKRHPGKDLILKLSSSVHVDHENGWCQIYRIGFCALSRFEVHWVLSTLWKEGTTDYA